MEGGRGNFHFTYNPVTFQHRQWIISFCSVTVVWLLGWFHGGAHYWEVKTTRFCSSFIVTCGYCPRASAYSCQSLLLILCVQCFGLIFFLLLQEIDLLPSYHHPCSTLAERSWSFWNTLICVEWITTNLQQSITINLANSVVLQIMAFSNSQNSLRLFLILYR